MLQVDDINVYYGDLQALWDVSLHIDEGEIVALIGSNGAGKSTALRAISKLLPIKSGSVHLDGIRIDTAPPHEIAALGIRHVPEGRRLFGGMTVLENLEMGAITDHAKANRRASLELVFELYPILENRKRQLAWSLSGGEQQMLAIARGLMGMPRLLMLDEPSLGLAPLLVADIFDTITSINDQGVTVLLVEQNVEHALRLAHRAYVLENGRIVLEGPGEELLHNESIVEAYLGV
jgi:branched-chain amino acid transport system ATP-binding protein